MLHNNHLMGHVKSYYNLTIYITYHKHLVLKTLSSELNKSSTINEEQKQYVFYILYLLIIFEELYWPSSE